jgi:hypothetical protein
MAKTRAKLPKMAAPVVMPEPELLSDAQPVDVVTPSPHSGRYRVRSLQSCVRYRIPQEGGLFRDLYHHDLVCEAPYTDELQRLVDNKCITIEEI